MVCINKQYDMAKYICEACGVEVDPTTAICDNCGAEFVKNSVADACKPKTKTSKRVDLRDEDATITGTDVSVTEQYNELVATEGEDKVAEFFGTIDDFTSLVSEAVDADNDEGTVAAQLIEMYYAWVEDPEGFLQDLESSDAASISTNKKSKYVIDQLMGAGLTYGKAVALLAYHGGMKALRSVKDAKSLLKFKHLKDMISFNEATRVVNHLQKKKGFHSAYTR